MFNYLHGCPGFSFILGLGSALFSSLDREEYQAELAGEESITAFESSREDFIARNPLVLSAQALGRQESPFRKLLLSKRRSAAANTGAAATEAEAARAKAAREEAARAKAARRSGEGCS